MKYSNFQAFEKHLKEAAPQQHFTSVYMIMTKDDYLRKQAEEVLVGYLLGDKKKQGLTLFDGTKVKTEILAKELSSFELFSRKKIVLVRQAEKLNKPITDMLVKRFSQQHQDLFMVFVATHINKSTLFYKNAEKYGVVLEIPEDKHWERESALINWVMQHIHSRGMTIDQNAANLLVSMAGQDRSLLNQEIEKLFCYIGERTRITTDDVQDLATTVNLKTVWQLGDAIFRKDFSEASRMSRFLVGDRHEFLPLLRGLRSQFQTKCQVCSILDHGGNAGDIMRQFPQFRGKILDQNIQLARGYGLLQLKKGILAIDDLELKLKSVQTDHKILFDALLIKLTAR